MQMIRQDHGRCNRKRLSRSHPAKRGPEKADLLGQQPEPPVGQIDRKEVAPAGEEVFADSWESPDPGRKIRWVSLSRLGKNALQESFVTPAKALGLHRFLNVKSSSYRHGGARPGHPRGAAHASI
jgi:hypothetical protein